MLSAVLEGGVVHKIHGVGFGVHFGVTKRAEKKMTRTQAHAHEENDPRIP